MQHRHQGNVACLSVFVPALVLMPGSPASADFIWTGLGGDALWTTDANWQGGTAPGTNVGMGLTFGPTGAAQSPNAGAISWTGITFLNFTNADSAFSIVGTGSLTFADAANITNDSAIAQSIGVDLVAAGTAFNINALAGDLSILGNIDINGSGGVALTIQGDFDTSISGAISGSGSLIKSGDGTLTLARGNTYLGGTELRGGTVVVAASRVFSTGTAQVFEDTELRVDGNNRTLRNIFSIDEDKTLTIGGSGKLNILARVEGDGALTIDMDNPNDQVHLPNRNSYSTLTLVQGTLKAGNADSVGRGNVFVNGAGAIKLVDPTLSFDNDFRIRASAELTFKGKEDIRIIGRILGRGDLRIKFKEDVDTLFLLRDNSRLGDTILERGTILLGNDKALGSGDLIMQGDGAISSNSFLRILRNDVNLNDHNLTFSGSFSLRYTGIMSGTGGLIIESTVGIPFTITRDQLFTGDLEVKSGAIILRKNASLAGNVLLSRGAFRGTGFVAGNMRITDDGLLFPGDNVGFSLGDLPIGGNLIAEKNGAIQIQFDADKQDTDRILVDGKATLKKNSIINAVIQGTGYIPSGSTFTAITAAGGIKDNGAIINTVSPSLTLSIIRDPNFVNGDTTYGLQMFRSPTAYSSAASPGNTKTIGAVLDSQIPVADNNPNSDAASLLGRLDALPANQYNLALSQLSPQSYNSLTIAGIGQLTNFHTQQAAYLAARRAGVEQDWSPWRSTPPPGALAWAGDDNYMLAAAIAQSIQSDETSNSPAPLIEALPEEKRWGSFIKLQSVWGDQDPDFNISGYSSTSLGAQFGFDYRFAQNFTAGIAFGYVNTRVSVSQDGGLMNEHSVRAGPYATWSNGNWYVDASLTGGYHFYANDRKIPALGLTAESNFNGWDITGYLGAGYHCDLGKHWLLTPNAALQYSYFSFDGFTESGAPSANLSVNARTSDSLKSRLGATVTYVGFDWGAKVYPSAYIGWEHEFLDDSEIGASFIGTGGPFLIDTGTRDKDALYLGLQVALLFERNVTGYFRFENARGSTSDVRGVALGLNISF